MRIEDNRNNLLKRRELLEKVKEIIKIQPIHNDLKNLDSNGKEQNNSGRSFQEILEEEIRKQK